MHYIILYSCDVYEQVIKVVALAFRRLHSGKPATLAGGEGGAQPLPCMAHIVLR